MTAAAGEGRMSGSRRGAKAGWMAAVATTVGCVGLPVTMVIANKSAPAVLGLSAVLATTAALLIPDGPRRLAARYCACIRSGTAIALAVLAIVAIASLIWSIAPSLTRRGLIEAAPELLSALLLATAWPLTARRGELAILLPLGLVLASALIVLEARSGMPLHRLVGLRALPFDLKRSAIPLVLLFWPTMALLRRPTPLWARGLIGVAVLAATLAAHSGASVVALVLSTAIYGVARALPRFSLGAAAVLALALVVLTPWTGTLVRHLVPPRVAEMLSGQHAEERIAIWSLFGRHIRDKHLIGHGFSTSFKIAEDVVDPAAAVTGADMIIDKIHPHNVVLQIWIEFGTLGAVLIGAGLVFATLRLRGMRSDERATRLSFLGSAATVALVGLNAWAPWWLAVMALGLTLFALERTELDVPTSVDQ